MSSGERTIGAVPEVDLDGALDELFAEVEALEGRALDGALSQADRLARRATALRTAIVERAERTQRFRDDGHRSVRAWMVAVTRTTNTDAVSTARAARTLRNLPTLRDAFAAGTVPVASVLQVTRRAGNPRCVDQLGEFDTVFAHWAPQMPAEDFARLMVEWERRADPDGAHSEHHDAVEHTNLSTGWAGLEFHGRFQCGALHGAEFESLLERLSLIEFEADWAEAVGRLGEGNVNLAVLARTPGRRAFDALLKALRIAEELTRTKLDDVACPTCGDDVPVPSTAASEPLVNIVIDWASFHDEPTRHTGAGTVLDPEHVRSWICQTDRGTPIDPADANTAALLGQVRRVLTVAPGVISEVGRKQRLFRGAARDAALLQYHQCIWPGCTTPASRCEADHLHPHRQGGPTDPINAGPACDHHNRFKHDHRYTTTRSPDGLWHILRPDGTEIT